MSVPYDLFDYPSYWETRSFEDKCERIALSSLLQRIKSKGSLLDIGGGYGRLSTFYTPLFTSGVVLEPSEKLIEIGREKFKDFSNLSFKKGELPQLPFESNSFDIALMVRVVHHLPTPLPAFKEINRILKQDGYFILEVANKIHFLERLKAALKGNFSFTSDLSPLEKRSQKSIEEEKITFLNHHPEQIEKDLSLAGFAIVETLSVSNFRSQLLKKFIPERWLLFLERQIQKPLAKSFFGPSLFILAKKNPAVGQKVLTTGSETTIS